MKPLLVQLLLVTSALAATPAPRPAAAPIAVPYAADRKLAQTDFERFEWTDAKRNRQVPVKIYFPTEGAGGAGPFAVIIFSHGLGGTREGYEYLGRQWAANGYVVVHLQHIGSDDSVWRGSTQPMQGMRAAVGAKTAIDRILDSKFAIDQLDSLNQNDEKLKGKLDLKHIGFAGHSYGAHTTQAMVGMGMGPRATNVGDPRITAAISMSPHVPAMHGNVDALMAGVKIPIFYMTGTKDDSPIGDTKADERKIPFEHTTNSPAAYFLVFNGGDHMIFSGRPRALADATRGTPIPGVGGGAGHDEDFQKQIRLASTAFWDAYLKNDAAAKKWLSDGDFAKELGDEGTFEKK